MPAIAKMLQTFVLAATVVVLLPAMPVSSAPLAGVAGGTVAAATVTDANVTDANVRERSAVIRTLRSPMRTILARVSTKATPPSLRNN